MYVQGDVISSPPQVFLRPCVLLRPRVCRPGTQISCPAPLTPPPPPPPPRPCPPPPPRPRPPPPSPPPPRPRPPPPSPSPPRPRPPLLANDKDCTKIAQKKKITQGSFCSEFNGQRFRCTRAYYFRPRRREYVLCSYQGDRCRSGRRLFCPHMKK
mmetsp:Transcript_48472/g.80471  ORF Transcript_48472/g.80471 Transcript_48472/m.80471 type:complete len:155 (-) Transcript_48472:360-824(-)